MSRGTVVDQDALLKALDTGKLSLASLDVTDPEPLPEGHPLYAHPRVRISPHTSAYAPAVDRALQEKFLRNLQAWHDGKPMQDLVEPGREY